MHRYVRRNCRRVSRSWARLPLKRALTARGVSVTVMRIHSRPGSDFYRYWHRLNATYDDDARWRTRRDLERDETTGPSRASRAYRERIN